MNHNPIFNNRCPWYNSLMALFGITIFFLFSFESVAMAQGTKEQDNSANTTITQINDNANDVSITAGLTEEDPLPIQGDVNCDNNVDFSDVLFILQYVVGLHNDSGSCDLVDDNSLHAAAGDVNDDNITTAVDALFILQCIEGVSNVFCSPDEALDMMNTEVSAAAIEARQLLVEAGLLPEQDFRIFVPLAAQ